MKRRRWHTPKSITIATRFYPYEHYPHHRPERIVPAIRLAGEWLRRHGFNKGAKVNVAAEKGRLVLTVER